jgi:hypothetical protein
MRCSIIFCILCTVCIQSCKKDVQAYTDIESLTQLLVWNSSPFNAFTDLIHFDGVYYCAFREGTSHTSDDGQIRIIESTDGNKWNKFSLLSLYGRDLRDSHFFIDNNNILSLGISSRDAYRNRQNVIYKLINGQFIQAGEANVDNDYLLWSFSRFKDSLYSIGYNIKQACYSGVNNEKPKLSLFRNTDTPCTSFGSVRVHNWLNASFVCPSEASTVFTPDSTMITIVRDQDILSYSHIGISKFPFDNWQWKEFPYFVRGPKLALLPNGKLFLCAASLIDVFTTYYVILNPKNNFSVEKIKIFPSGGDSGYPGVVIEGNTALISYYSSHEGNARVYIDRITY